jgi:hypothetical protein
VEWEFLVLVSRIYLPLLPADAEPADGRPTELEPVAAFVQHQRRVFVVIILGWTRLQLFFDEIFLGRLLFLGWRLEGEC